MMLRVLAACSSGTLRVHTTAREATVKADENQPHPEGSAEAEDELREEDVMREDCMDDRVEEGDGLPGDEK